MSDYHRTTRECIISQLQPELLQAIRDYFREQQLGDPEAETLLCCETISEKKRTGRLISWLNDKADTTIYTGMILTAECLIWVRSGDHSDTLLTAANLKDIQARAHVSILPDENGLDVIGYTRNSFNRIRGYIGMGSDLAAQKFCEAVEQAAAKLKPPRKKPFSQWLGG